MRKVGRCVVFDQSAALAKLPVAEPHVEQLGAFLADNILLEYLLFDVSFSNQCYLFILAY